MKVKEENNKKKKIGKERQKNTNKNEEKWEKSEE